MDDKRIKRHRDNVRRMKQEKRRTPEWYAKKSATLSRAWSRFHPMELDPADRSWYYDGDGTKRDKETDEVYND
jgi:4-aminobutyrate aminotransferase-like enzyme